MSVSPVVQGLMSILLEIETYDAGQVPPYRSEEVRAAEAALASARVDYRALLMHHRLSLEKEDDTQQLQNLLTMPSVALCVLTARFQQIQRGLRIYAYHRTQRLVAVAIRMALAGQRTIDEGTLNKLAAPEQQTLRHILTILQTYELAEKLRDLPHAPDAERGRAWSEPALWIHELADRLRDGDEGKIKLLAALEEQLADYSFGDLRV